VHRAGEEVSSVESVRVDEPKYAAISAVEIDRDGSVGYYVDDAGYLKAVELAHAAALVIQREVDEGQTRVFVEI
jgi:hypothetical protein